MKRILAVALATATVLLGTANVAQAEQTTSTCDATTDVPILVNFGDKGPAEDVLCAHDAVGGTAQEAMKAAGLELTTDQSSGFEFICSVNAYPGNCDTSAAYWSFWVSASNGDWGYATVGANQYELVAGDEIAFAYVSLDDTNPPATAAGDGLRDKASASTSAPVNDLSDDSTSVPTWLLITGAVVLIASLGVAGVFVSRKLKED